MRTIAVICLLVACAGLTTAALAQKAMKVVMIVKDDDGAGTVIQSYEFTGIDTILIGRDLTNHIRLPSRYASRSHAKITCFSGNECLLTDLRSSNGTTLNGAPVPYGKNLPLKNGDVIGIPDYQIDWVQAF